MRIIREENYAALSRRAAEIVLAAVREKPDCVLGLATGSTPIGAYDCLAEAYRERKATFQAVRTINLDEYAGLGADDAQSYRHSASASSASPFGICVFSLLISVRLKRCVSMKCR